MIIVDPVVLGDAACTRPSPKWVYDRTGTLVEVPANTLGVTYDPADLSKAPWALLEPEAANLLTYSEQFTNPVWVRLNAIVSAGSAISPTGVMNAAKLVESAANGFHEIRQSCAVAAGEIVTVSVYAKAGERSRVRLAGFASVQWATFPQAIFDLSDGTLVSGAGAISHAGNGWYRCSISAQVSPSATGSVGAVYCPVLTTSNNYQGDGNSGLYIFGAQLTLGERVESYIRTDDAAVTRAADVVGPGAGLIYSNVPMVEPPYSATTTYAKDAAVYDPVTKIVYWSMQAANVGKPLSDGSWWNKRTAANRWAMLDDRNSTQTSNPEEIIAVFSARAITQGLFAGALDASEVLVSMTHPTRGLVYSEARNLVLPRSGSSFFGWCFNRLRLRKWFLTLKLPVFANALVTVTIRKPGGVARCGMCLLGPVEDIGLSLMGLSTELKDYSTTTFFTDGTSDTVVRGFSKKMTVDISVETDRIETIEDDLIGRRQKTIVWLGSTLRGDAILVGKFASFRKVIESFRRSKMALQIDGVLSQ